MIEITEEDFNISKVIEEAENPDVGAVVTFLGIVRDDGISGMEIVVHEDAAAEELGKIRDEAMERFDIRSLDIRNRKGTLPIGGKILLVVCGAPHRKDAFLACEYVVDELHKRVPIQRKELP